MARMPKQLQRGAVVTTLALAVCMPLSLSEAHAATDGVGSEVAAPAGIEQPDCPSADGGSTSGYANASGAEAQDLFTQDFACILNSLAADPPDQPGDPGAAGATAAPDPSSDPLATPPLQTPDGSPVDLSLQSTGNGYEPADPLVDLTLPEDLGNGVPIGDSGITIDPGATDPSAAASTNADPVEGQGVFYAKAAPSTDVMLAPISQGLESVYQLRSADSPEQLTMGVGLPVGATLQEASAGGVDVVRDGQSVASFYPPLATDADGNPVAASMGVDGNSIELDVPHSDPGIAYPIAVTDSVGSFASGTTTINSRVTPGMNGVAPLSEGTQAADLGVKVLRDSVDWCSLEPSPNHYSQGTLQGIVDFVQRAWDGYDKNSPPPHPSALAFQTLIDLYTSAPNFARTAEMQSNPAPCTDAGGNDAASIAAAGDAGVTNGTYYADAMRQIAWCLNGSQHCDDNVYSGSSPGHVDTNGQMLANGYVYGFEVGNEVNTSHYWQDGKDPTLQMTKSQANIYYNVLERAATIVHTYAQNAGISIKVGSAGLSYGSPDGRPWGDAGGNVDATSYLDQVLSNGNPGANAYSIHPYGKGLHPDMVYANGVPGNSDVAIDTGGTRQILLNRGYGYTKPIWITEVGVTADYNGDNDVSPDEEYQQYSDLYFTWWNTIRGVCDSWNVPLAIFYTFTDPHVYGYGDDGLHPKPNYYAGFVKKKLVGTPPEEVDDYSKLAYSQFDSGQILTANTCTG